MSYPAGNHLQAIEHFKQGAELAARHHKSESAGQLSLGYIALTKLAMEPESKDAAAELEAAKKKLTTMHEGAFFVGQLDVAAKVFLK